LTQFSISLAICQGDDRIDNEADPLMGVRIVMCNAPIRANAVPRQKENNFKQQFLVTT
jgi:hypothetical protein